jgi:hypothetical protein
VSAPGGPHARLDRRRGRRYGSVRARGAIEAFGTGGGGFAWIDIAPLLAVSAASALDAYRLAVINNYLVRMREHTGGTARSCPECGRPLDDDLEFCHWCSTRLVETPDGVEPAESIGDAGDADSERYPLE